MDVMFATTLAFLAVAMLVLLFAVLMLRKNMGNVDSATAYGIIGLGAAFIVAWPLHRFGVMGTLEATIAWQHTMPYIGGMLLGSYAVGIALVLPCFAKAFTLARAGFIQHRVRARITARLNQLRRDVRNSH